MSNLSDVEAVTWEKFRKWFPKVWEPGQHVAMIGPTGMGKTTFANGILPMRKYVLAIDPKGGDTTLARLTTHGFVRSKGWPPKSQVRRDIRSGKPARLIVGPVVQTTADVEKQTAVFAAALDGAFDEGGWTVYIDELQLLSDRRMMNLTGKVERNLIAARDRGVSMVTSFQRPAFVPRSASDQASWLAVWYTRDRDVVKRLSEMTGRPGAEIQGAMNALERYTVLLFSRVPTEPIRVVRPPRS